MLNVVRKTRTPKVVSEFSVRHQPNQKGTAMQQSKFTHDYAEQHRGSATQMQSDAPTQSKEIRAGDRTGDTRRPTVDEQFWPHDDEWVVEFYVEARREGDAQGLGIHTYEGAHFRGFTIEADVYHQSYMATYCAEPDWSTELPQVINQFRVEARDAGLPAWPLGRVAASNPYPN